MSTVNTVKAQLQSLIEFANEKTGKSDTDLTSAVNTVVNERDSLIDGSVIDFYSESNKLVEYAFAGRRKLTSVYLPNTTSIPAVCFYRDECLKNVIIPKVSYIVGNAFGECVALECIDLFLCYSIAASAFLNCSLLNCVILRKSDKVCTLSNANAFAGTPIASGTGYIYVPRCLLSDVDETMDYRRATNWTTFASQFRVLEDYTVDGTKDGELDWDKVNGGDA